MPPNEQSASQERYSPTGRPSDYDPKYDSIAAYLSRNGATMGELAEAFDVHVATVYRWANAHESFRDAIKAYRHHADDRVERALYERATGYTHDAVKLHYDSKIGRVIETPVKEHVPPDTTAAIFWLKNRRPQQWRDAKQIDVRASDPLHDEQARQLAESFLEAQRRLALGTEALGAVYDGVSARLPTGGDSLPDSPGAGDGGAGSDHPADHQLPAEAREVDAHLGTLSSLVSWEEPE